MKELGLYDLTPGTLRLRKNAAKLIDSSGSCAIKYT